MDPSPCGRSSAALPGGRWPPSLRGAGPGLEPEDAKADRLRPDARIVDSRARELTKFDRPPVPVDAPCFYPWQTNFPRVRRTRRAQPYFGMRTVVLVANRTPDLGTAQEHPGTTPGCDMRIGPEICCRRSPVPRVPVLPCSPTQSGCGTVSTLPGDPFPPFSLRLRRQGPCTSWASQKREGIAERPRHSSVARIRVKAGTVYARTYSHATLYTPGWRSRAEAVVDTGLDCAWKSPASTRCRGQLCRQQQAPVKAGHCLGREVTAYSSGQQRSSNRPAGRRQGAVMCVTALSRSLCGPTGESPVAALPLRSPSRIASPQTPDRLGSLSHVPEPFRPAVSPLALLQMDFKAATTPTFGQLPLRKHQGQPWLAGLVSHVLPHQ